MLRRILTEYWGWRVWRLEGQLLIELTKDESDESHLRKLSLNFGDALSYVFKNKSVDELRKWLLKVRIAATSLEADLNMALFLKRLSAVEEVALTVLQTKSLLRA